MSARPCALGGGPLDGDKLVHFIYLDESGTGDPQHESHVVVAGVMVHADKQWKKVERELIDMADAFALPEDRPNFCFHAYDLYSGGKQEFRTKYPWEKRRKFLQALCEIPVRFALPVFMFAINRKDYIARYTRPGESPDEIMTHILLHATGCCSQGVNTFIEKTLPAEEVATLVYEQNGRKSLAVTEYHKFFRSEFVEDALKDLSVRRMSRLDRIIEAPFHQTKTDSSLLQLADVCAYVLGRKIRGVGIANEFCQPLLRQLVWGNKTIYDEASAFRRAGNPGVLSPEIYRVDQAFRE